MEKKQIIEYVKKNADTTILSFPDRGPWGQASYRGNFSGWIPASLIYRYDAHSVSEIFAGGGTTSDLCKDLELPYVGIDLNPNPVRNNIISMNILDEEMELPDGFYDADLQILHPPYPGINNIHYSNNMWKDTKAVAVNDIQEMSWDKGMNAINKAILRGYAAMPSGSYQAVVVGDIRRKVNGKSTFHSMMTNLAIPGELVQILVKMQHNTVSGRNNYDTNKKNFFMVAHEFIVVVKKPSGYEIAYVMPKTFKCDIRDSVQTATWKDVVYTVLRELGKTSTLDEIYNEVEGHEKTKNNPHWKEKVRQMIYQLAEKGIVETEKRGYWRIKEAV